jgi:myo-inositol-1(or 4)-monophosphatase
VKVTPPSPTCPVPLAQAAAFEATALRLAQAAGMQIAAAVNGELTVQFKETRPEWAANSNPVSQVDQSVERFIRDELSRAQPGDAIIGEEQPISGPPDAATSWVIDPVDGTVNFINGAPLYACSIGVLHEGWPVAGAIWCASTHAVGPGVYHAHAGGPLCFNGRPLERRKPGNWRGLAADHGRTSRYAHWDHRVLGTAAVEFAWVACGVLRLAHMPRPGLWDAAAGLVLLHAAGCSALTWEHGRWEPLLRFKPPSGKRAENRLAAWQQPVLIGAADDLAAALQEPRPA